MRPFFVLAASGNGNGASGAQDAELSSLRIRAAVVGARGTDQAALTVSVRCLKEGVAGTSRAGGAQGASLPCACDGSSSRLSIWRRSCRSGSMLWSLRGAECGTLT